MSISGVTIEWICVTLRLANTPTGARHDRDSNPSHHGCEGSSLSLSYPAIPMVTVSFFQVSHFPGTRGRHSCVYATRSIKGYSVQSRQVSKSYKMWSFHFTWVVSLSQWVIFKMTIFLDSLLRSLLHAYHNPVWMCLCWVMCESTNWLFDWSSNILRYHRYTFLHNTSLLRVPIFNRF